MYVNLQHREYARSKQCVGQLLDQNSYRFYALVDWSKNAYPWIIGKICLFGL